jgi:hypothetical protein
LTWNNGKKPKFAGRYFLGQPYLWAHGEGSEAKGQIAIERIVPIQRPNPDRQQAKDDEGDRYGFEDAQAICEYLDKCIQMDELKITNKFVYVFLDVTDDTELSIEYWSSWSATVQDHILGGEKSITVGSNTILVPTLSNPYLPCICCKFVKADQASFKYIPEEKVLNCLNNSGKNLVGKQIRCYGFWARVTENPTYHTPEPALDWSVFDTYRQPQGSNDQLVRILLWRFKDVSIANPPDIPQGDKLTLDAAHEEIGQTQVSNFMLQVENWSTIKQPTQFGVDRGRNISNVISCLARETMWIRRLPAAPEGLVGNVTLRGKTSFAIRYYSTSHSGIPGLKDLTTPEASAIVRSGVAIVVTWQSRVKYCDIPKHLTNINHPEQGFEDARDAFSYAANVIRQPPYTPVYFAIDALVSKLNGTTRCQRDDGTEEEIAVPTTVQITNYFRDVNRGYLQYLQEQTNNNLEPVPYYIGVYASSNVLDACYLHGLTTHFWQAWPPIWGDDPNTHPNLNVWRHNNIWQVLLWDTPLAWDGPALWAINENIVNCARPDGVDLNVAWGDPGGWKI